MTIIPKKIAIIGVGLIGGSIALGLKKRLGPKITILGTCFNPKRSLLAQKNKIIDQVWNSDDKIDTDCNLIIISTPILSVIPILKKILTNLPAGSLIIDVSSTKEDICNRVVEVLPKNIFFLGTHPIAGSQLTGFENASNHLFINKPWVICPTGQTSPKSLNIVKKLIKILGAKSITISPNTHDQLVSWSSHLSLITSCILFSTVSKQKRWRVIANIAFAGLIDTTRLASHNPDLNMGIIKTNRKNIIHSLCAYKKEIDEFMKILKKNDDEKILNYFIRAKTLRDKWLAKFNK